LSFATRSPRLPHFDVPFAIVSRCWFSIRGPHGPQVIDYAHLYREKAIAQPEAAQRSVFRGACALLVIRQKY
jgi:hypothetical protein